jgi:prepilin-type N-terminal cleavage/methylation domain-containing protein
MRRGGFTILELMLVMAIIVIAFALAFPSFEAMLASSREFAARDMVRGHWAEMRAKALEENRPYRFAVTENTSKFRIAPDDDTYWSGNSTGEGADDKPLIIEGELPDGVLFTTSAEAFAGEAAPAPGALWGLTVAVYLGEGIARDDAEIYFGRAGQRPLGLRLRALTGAVSSIDASSKAEAQP